MKLTKIKTILQDYSLLLEDKHKLITEINTYISKSENINEGELLLKKIINYLNSEEELQINQRIEDYFDNKLIGLSLFSNVGIAELYSEEYVNFRVSNELLKDRANFQREMYPKTNVIQGDILTKDIFNEVIAYSQKINVDFIMATPPCQGMSLAGKMEEDDPRNKLIIKVVEAIKIIQPKYFLIENVSKMPDTYIIFNQNKIKIKDFLQEELSGMYHINIDILNAKDFGTPQSRRRAFVLGSLKEFREWESPTKKEKEITVRDAIEYLPSLESGEASLIPYHYAKKHNKRHIKWMTHTPSGKTSHHNKIHFPQKEDGTKIKGFDTTYKRISWDKPAPTITMANGSVSSQNNVHPGRKKDDDTYSDARVLTLKEIFILTGLPDKWSPPDSASEGMIRKVIGEGVPPKLIEALLKTIPKD